MLHQGDYNEGSRGFVWQKSEEGEVALCCERNIEGSKKQKHGMNEVVCRRICEGNLGNG